MRLSHGCNIGQIAVRLLETLSFSELLTAFLQRELSLMGLRRANVYQKGDGLSALLELNGVSFISFDSGSSETTSVAYPGQNPHTAEQAAYDHPTVMILCDDWQTVRTGLVNWKL